VETPEQLYERAAGALRMPPVHEWDEFPFEGDIRVRTLAPPVEAEPPRVGEGGVDCFRCAARDEHYVWTDERWRLAPLPEPSGLPVVVLLEPRIHCDFPDLPDDLALELGPLMLRVERAVRSVGEIGRVHIGRWGDGSEHAHFWFFGRPARIPQLRTSFAAIWADILPPLPEELWRSNLAAVGRALAADGGTAHIS
jgi:diadenosine tetraphosphate (Ap4A) HIT family hydrolase